MTEAEDGRQFGFGIVSGGCTAGTLHARDALVSFGNWWYFGLGLVMCGYNMCDTDLVPVGSFG